MLNQVYERDTDALMRRTRMRPLPDGRVGAGRRARLRARAVGGRPRAARRSRQRCSPPLLALATLVVYLVVYTPMKRRSPLATLVGAVPGALPPLIGWAAAHGGISIGGVALFAIVFLWQIPHFMAIAWLYRDDYAKAGFPMLPVIEPDGRRTGRQAVVYAAALLPVEPRADAASASAACVVLLASRSCSASRSLCAGRRASRSTRTDASARAAVLRVDHLPAAPLDRR